MTSRSGAGSRQQHRDDDESVLAPRPRAPVEPLAAAPSFSVVIGAYQAAETIAAAVRSALAQVHPAHEVIVVDDGSTDDLEQVLRQFEGQVRVISKENGGGASALNAGAAAATGDFVAILDSDDAYHPRRIEALARLAASRPDLDLITTDALFVVGGEGVGTFAGRNPFAISDQRTAIFESCFVGGWPAVRLSRLRALGGFDESLRTGYDWDCWTRLILEGAQAGLIGEPYYEYRVHSGSLTASRVSSLWDRVRVLEKAERNPALSSADRPALGRAMRRHRTRAVIAEVQAALYDSGSRRRLAGLTVTSGIDLRARLLTALALTAPALARRLVQEPQPPEERFVGEGE